jgi:hypothetical protein
MHSVSLQCTATRVCGVALFVTLRTEYRQMGLGSGLSFDDLIELMRSGALDGIRRVR